MTPLAFVAVVSAIGLAVAFATGSVVYPLWALVAERSARLARASLLVAAVPTAVAAAVVVASLLPGDPHLGQYLACHCGTSGPGWAHLCPVHPESALGLLSLGLATLAVLLPGRVVRWRRLGREPHGSGAGATPTLLDLPRPVAFLVGWRRPSLVVDASLWGSLDPVERTVLLAHERAHLQRRDPAVLMAIRVLTSVAPRWAEDRLARAWLRRAELCADASAADEVGDPLLVAETLVKSARLARGVGPSLALGWTASTVEVRVRALLQPEGRAPGALGSSPDVGTSDLGLLLAAAVVVVVATPWVHHHLEHLLNLSF